MDAPAPSKYQRARTRRLGAWQRLQPAAFDSGLLDILEARYAVKLAERDRLDREMGEMAADLTALRFARHNHRVAEALAQMSKPLSLRAPSTESEP